jgi:CRISPR system Cascade subunit CasD
MSASTAYLALLLDAPLQSWGFASQFQRRTTGLHPTKSAVIGTICAAMGIGKGTSQERETLPQLAVLTMTSIAIPRGSNPVRRTEDFHTVQKTRRASGKMNDDPVVTRRQYLLDARFGIILGGDPALLERVASALQDPLWGVWLGRKSCIPARPLLVAVCRTYAEAWQAILRSLDTDEALPIESFTRVEDVDDFAAGTDSYNDQPVSFGRADSSSEGRAYSVRRVRLEPGA